LISVRYSFPSLIWGGVGGGAAGIIRFAHDPSWGDLQLVKTAHFVLLFLFSQKIRKQVFDFSQK
jgi:hypothetical protein